jgi:hypothetical protein
VNKRLILFSVPIVVTMACVTLTRSGSISMMTKDQLKATLENPDLTIVDVAIVNTGQE